MNTTTSNRTHQRRSGEYTIDMDHQPEVVLVTAKPRMPRAFWYAAGAVALSAVLALSVIGTLPRIQLAQALAHESQTQQADGREVVVDSPKLAPAKFAITLPATIRPFRETTLFARTNGYLKSMLVDIGDRVHAGQLLAEIESPEVDHRLSEEKARLEQSEANLVIVQKQLDRLKQLLAVKAISPHELEDQQAIYNESAATVDVYKATVARLSTEQSYERVVAPFDGVVTARSIDPGALITAGSGATVTSILTVSQTDTLRVFVNVPQSVYPSIFVGQTAKILVAEMPDGQFEGNVVRTAGVLDESSRTLKTEVHIPNQDETLTAGLYVQVEFQMDRSKSILRIPSQALVTRADGPKVAVVGENSIVKFVPVVLGNDLGADIEVVRGLEISDRFVANPNDEIKEGQNVRTKVNDPQSKG